MARLKVYDQATASWKLVSPVQVATTSPGPSAPPAPTDGMLWWDTDDTTPTPEVVVLDARYVPLASGAIFTDAARSIANTAAVAIAWSTEVSDPDGWCAGTSAVICPAGKAGTYLVSYTGKWATASGTLMGVHCELNAAVAYASSEGALWGVTTLTFVRTLAVGDSMVFKVWHNQGSAVNIDSRLEIKRG